MEKTDLAENVIDPNQKALDLAIKYSQMDSGEKAGVVTVACIERMLAITRQPNCPDIFKLSVISMMAGAILEIAK